MGLKKVTGSYQKKEPFEGKRFPFRITVQKHRKELVHLHWHEHLEFIKVIEGNVSVTIDGQKMDASQNDIIFINSGCTHSVYADTDTNAVILGMVFDKFFLTNIIEGFDTQQVYFLLAGRFKIEKKFGVSHPIWAEMNRCIERVYHESIEQDILYEMSIKSSIYRIITVLMRYFKNDIIGEEAFVRVTEDILRLKPVFRHIDENYPAKITIEDLSSCVNMSSFYFTRFFKKVTNKTPMEYVHQVRLNMAMRLLVNSQFSVTEIAEKTGFCNINYFDKKFKDKMGITPSEYKKRGMQDNVEALAANNENFLK